MAAQQSTNVLLSEVDTLCYETHNRRKRTCAIITKVNTPKAGILMVRFLKEGHIIKTKVKRNS